MKPVLVMLSVVIVLSVSVAQAQNVEYANEWRRVVKVEISPPQTYVSGGGIVYSQPVYRQAASQDNYDQGFGREVYLADRPSRGPGEVPDSSEYGHNDELTYQGGGEYLPPPPEVARHSHGDDLGCCSCRDIFLGCVFPCGNKGSFVLRCDDTGVATYFLDRRCVRAASLEKICQDRHFVYYRERESRIRWAFSREPVSRWHSVWISHKRNPLDSDWRPFCRGIHEEDCHSDHCHDGHCHH